MKCKKFLLIPVQSGSGGSSPDISAHVNNSAIHAPLDDSGESALTLWSSEKVSAEIALVIEAINTHIADNTVHPVLDDGQVTNANVLSAEAIHALLVELSSVPGSTKFVSPAFPAKDAHFTTIQAAIDDADDGDLICIFPGDYPESITFPDTALSVFAFPKVNISGSGQSDEVYFAPGSKAVSLRGYATIECTGRVRIERDSEIVLECSEISSSANVGILISDSPTLNVIVPKISGNVAGVQVLTAASDAGTISIFSSEISGTNIGVQIDGTGSSEILLSAQSITGGTGLGYYEQGSGTLHVQNTNISATSAIKPAIDVWVSGLHLSGVNLSTAHTYALDSLSVPASVTLYGTVSGKPYNSAQITLLENPEWYSGNASNGSGSAIFQPSGLPYTMDQFDEIVLSHPEIVNEQIVFAVMEYDSSSGIANLVYAFDTGDAAKFDNSHPLYAEFDDGIIELIPYTSAGVSDACAGGSAIGSMANPHKAFAFDGSNIQVSAPDSVSFWIGYAWLEAVIVTQFNSQWITLPENPSVSWTFEGSNNGSDWTEIASGASLPTNEVFANATPYLQYRMDVSISDPGSLVDVVLSNIEMYITGYFFAPVTFSTNASGSVTLTELDQINSLTVNYAEPNATKVAFLVSFDERLTWEYYSGATWQTAAGGLADISTVGMTPAELSTAFQNFSPAGSTMTLDIAVMLYSQNGVYSPSLDSISIEYTQFSSWVPATVGSYADAVSYGFLRVDQTTSRIQKLSAGTSDVIVNILL